MRILIAHNHYRQPGGEDAVVKSESELLRMFGDEVCLYERDNAELEGLTWRAKWQAVGNITWSRAAYDDLTKVLKEFRPDVAHFHNIFYMLTPSVYGACRDQGVPVVQSLHNFRLLCANGLFFRSGKVCEECLDHGRWRGVLHACYHHSPVVTGAVVQMMNTHWNRGTWTNQVDAYITATEFTRRKYISAGIPAEKIMVKSNFVYPDPGHQREVQDYALYVGRLSGEKGVETLLEAWARKLPIPLHIIGGGPEEAKFKSMADRLSLKDVHFYGYVTGQEYDRQMRSAKFLLVPSVCYENFPRIVAEAFAYGLPVLASRLGSLAEIIEEGRTGKFFKPGEAEDLAESVRWLAGHPQHVQEMGQRARQVFENQYSAAENYRRLQEVYTSVRPMRASVPSAK